MGQGMDQDRLFDTVEYAVNEQRDGENMVEMTVRQKDMFDARNFIEAQLVDATPCVDEHLIINEE